MTTHRRPCRSSLIVSLVSQLTGTIDATTDRKSSSWFVDPLSRPSLMAAVKRSSAHVYPYMSSVNRLSHTRLVNDSWVYSHYSSRACMWSFVSFFSSLHHKSNEQLQVLPFERQSSDIRVDDSQICNETHESHDQYDADDEDDTCSREAEAVESMLTLTGRVGSRKLNVNPLQWWVSCLMNQFVLLQPICLFFLCTVNMWNKIRKIFHLIRRVNIITSLMNV